MSTPSPEGPSSRPRVPGTLAVVLGRSLVLRIAAVVALAIVIGGSMVFVVDGRLTRSALSGLARADLDNDARVLRAEIDGIKEDLAAEVRSLAEAIGARGLEDSPEDFVGELAHAFRSFELDAVAAFRRSGGTIAAIGLPVGPPDPSMVPRARRVVVGFSSAKNGTILLSAVMPFGPIDRGGLIVGGIAFDAAFAYQLRGVIQRDVVLIAQGTVIGSTLIADLADVPGVDHAGPIPMDEPMLADVGGVQALVRYRHVLGSDDPFGATIGLVVPEPVAALDPALGRSRWFGAVGLLVFASGLAWVLLRMLVRPLAGLAERAESIARGGDPTGVESMPMGRLAESLERLAGSLANLRRVDSARSLFVANAAHELRNPLAALAGLTETLAVHRHELSQESIEQIIGSLARQSDHLVALSSRLLDLTQIEEGVVPLAMERVEIGDLFDRTLAAQPPPHGVDVRIRVDGSLWLEADPVRVREIVGNVLSNAYRYGGRRITLEAHRADDGIILAIEDDGPGVSPDVVPRLFQPFAPSPVRVPEGSGLGLAITRGIVRAHGGDIRYDPRPGKGARFVITMPDPSRPEVAPSVPVEGAARD